MADGASVTPVVFKLENAVLIARFNQDRKDPALLATLALRRLRPTGVLRDT